MSLTSRNASIRPLKSRLGCITCKIRKVKCGEEKPQCLRCSSTGRKCEYASRIISTHASKASGIITLQSYFPSPPSASRRERRAFAYYFEHAAKYVGGELDADFWRLTVPQICLAEPAVWDAIIAISSFFESSSSLVFSTRGFSPAFSQPYQDALTWYSRSVSAVRHGIERGDVDSFVGLITCVLFICIEAIMGSLEEAKKLFEQGVRLTISLWAQKSLGGLRTTQLGLLRDTIIPIFLRLASVSSRNTWSLMVDMVQHTECTLSLPRKFHSLRSAREAIVMLSAEISLFEQTCELYLQNSRTWTLPEDMALQRKSLSIRLDNWNVDFTDLMNSLGDSHILSPLNRSMCALLSSYYEMCFIALGVCGSPIRTSTDDFERNFQTIVEKAATAVDFSMQRDGTRAPYTFEISLGLPLLFTCLRCREPTIRRKSLDLLRRTHQVQGLTNRDQGTALIELVMMLEESSATKNAPAGTNKNTSSQIFDESNDFHSYSQGRNLSSNPMSNAESEITAAISPSLTAIDGQAAAVTVIHQGARIRPHGIFRLGDDLPPELTEEDIESANLRPGQFYLHISRNEHDLHNHTWRMVHEFVPIDL